MMSVNTLKYFRDESKLASIVVFLLYVGIIVSCVSIISDCLQWKFLFNSMGNESLEMVEIAESNDFRQTIIDIFQLIQWMITYFLFFLWVYRANANAKALGAEGMKFSPAWSVGWFFIPIACLWKPYQVIKEIWLTSSNPAHWQMEKCSRIIGYWWSLWIISTGLSGIIIGFCFRAEESEQLTWLTTFEIISNCIEIIISALMIVIIKRINSMQKNVSQSNRETIQASVINVHC